MNYEILSTGEYQWTSSFRFNDQPITHYQLNMENYEWIRDHSDMLDAPLREIIDRLGLTRYSIKPDYQDQYGMQVCMQKHLVASLDDDQRVLLRMMD